jgi:hypothetical protein
VLDKILVVAARARRLDRLPRKHVADRVEPVAAQAGKVARRVRRRKGPPAEPDAVAVEKVARRVRRRVRLVRQLGVARDVDASQHHLPPTAVAELPIFDGEPDRHREGEAGCGSMGGFGGGERESLLFAWLLPTGDVNVS